MVSQFYHVTRLIFVCTIYLMRYLLKANDRKPALILAFLSFNPRSSWCRDVIKWMQVLQLVARWKLSWRRQMLSRCCNLFPFVVRSHHDGEIENLWFILQNASVQLPPREATLPCANSCQTDLILLHLLNDCHWGKSFLCHRSRTVTEFFFVAVPVCTSGTLVGSFTRL